MTYKVLFSRSVLASNHLKKHTHLNLADFKMYGLELYECTNVKAKKKGLRAEFRLGHGRTFRKRQVGDNYRWTF